MDRGRVALCSVAPVSRSAGAACPRMVFLVSS